MTVSENKKPRNQIPRSWSTLQPPQRFSADSRNPSGARFGLRSGRPARLLDHGVHRVRGQSTLAKPVINPLHVQIDGTALALRSVGAEVFHRGAVPARTRFSDDHTIER